MNDILFTPLRLSELEALIQNSVEKAFKNVAISTEIQNSSEDLLTIKQASEFLNLTVQTLYSYVHRAEIPVFKRQKKLYFSKDGRKKTSAEIKQAANDYINKKGLKYGR
jgi:hypothetical protein